MLIWVVTAFLVILKEFIPVKQFRACKHHKENYLSHTFWDKLKEKEWWDFISNLVSLIMLDLLNGYVQVK